MTYYVIHENSETTTRDGRIFDIFKICEIIIKELDNDKYKKSLTNLITMILLDYCAQQRYIKEHSQRKKFINEAFKMLNILDKNWRKCDYVFKLNKISRIIKTNKFLMLLYCDIFAQKYAK